VEARTTANITAPGNITQQGEDVVLPAMPYQGPTVNPQVIGSTWMPAIVRPETLPQLLALVPPAPPTAVPVEKPVEKPVVQPVEAPPTHYLAPKRPPKQDRH
jgi:hypothetical protein